MMRLPPGRTEIAMARGLDCKDDLLNPYLGDLGYIRHDILKHRGVASRKNSGRCKTLQWFKPSDDIFIMDSMVYEFMDGFGLAHPASGVVDASRTRYRFQGLHESPTQLRAVPQSADLLVANIRATGGRKIALRLPLDLPDS